MTRDGAAAVSWSKSNNSTALAVRENRLKLKPPATAAAPKGALRPVASTWFMTASTLMPVAPAALSDLRLVLRHELLPDGLHRLLDVLPGLLAHGLGTLG